MALTKEDLQAISGLLLPIHERLGKVDVHLEQLDTRLGKVESRLDQMDERFDKVDERFDKVEDKLEVMTFRQNHMSRKLDDLQLDLKVVKRDIERNIHALNDQMETVIVIMEANELLPKRKESW